jgi:predicted membrane protein
MNGRIWIFLLALLAAASAGYTFDGSDALFFVVCIIALAALHLSPKVAGAAAFGFCFLASSLLFTFGFVAYAFNLAAVSLALLVSALAVSLMRYRDSGGGKDFIAKGREVADGPAESRKEKGGRDRIRRLHVEDPRIPEK